MRKHALIEDRSQFRGRRIDLDVLKWFEWWSAWLVLGRRVDSGCGGGQHPSLFRPDTFHQRDSHRSSLISIDVNRADQLCHPRLPTLGFHRLCVFMCDEGFKQILDA